MRTVPTVTVIIPTHNRGTLLERAVDSVQKQTYSAIELIVVDDGSVDDTPERLAALQRSDPQIVGIRHPYPMGANAARNRGIARANGVFVMCLDDDDALAPECIERLVSAYDGRWAFVTSDETVKKGRDSTRWRKKQVVTPDDILYQNGIGNSALVERARMVAVGAYDELLPACQDYDLWIRLMQRYGSVKVVGEALQIKYKGHGLPTITGSSRAFKGYWQVFRKFRALINRKQRKTRLFHLYRIRTKRMSLQTARMLLVPENAKQVLKYYLKRR
jgi:glycosyltransferase involved in cell wall biosynthesis